METRVFLDNGIEYTYYISNKKVFLGTNSNQKSSIPRETTGKIYVPAFFISSGIKYAVSALSSYSFYYTNITAIFLPSTIDYISGGSFESNPKLELIDMSNTKIKKLFGYTMSRCIKLETVLFPKTLKNIENRTFVYCYILKEIRLPPNIECVEEGSFFEPLQKVVFCGTKDIKGVLPESVTSIIVPTQYSSDSFCGKTPITRQQVNCFFPEHIKCTVNCNKCRRNHHLVIVILIATSK